jgi:1-phosphofructokinase family hexose kinase
MDEFFELPGRTRENVTIVDHGQETHIRDVGLEVDGRNLERLKKKLGLMSRPGNVVIFSGSLPPGITPEDFRQLVTMVIAAGARVAVDTSGKALEQVAGLALWLIKPNVQELAELAGRELATLPEQLLAAQEQTTYAETVLFTHGADGAFLFNARGSLYARVAVPRDRVVSTVGCGDALLAAFVAASARGDKDRAALREAVACASASACTNGPAEFDPAVVNDLRGRVEVTDLPTDLTTVTLAGK